jgi:hypothetical protein
MDDLEAKIRRTLGLVRDAIRALEADPDVLREAVECLEKTNGSPLAIPGDKPDVILREIERLLASALERLECGAAASFTRRK